MAPTGVSSAVGGGRHLLRQRRLGQGKSVLGCLRTHLLFEVGAGLGPGAHSIATVSTIFFFGQPSRTEANDRLVRLLAAALGFSGPRDTGAPVHSFFHVP